MNFRDEREVSDGELIVNVRAAVRGDDYIWIAGERGPTQKQEKRQQECKFQEARQSLGFKSRHRLVWAQSAPARIGKKFVAGGRRCAEGGAANSTTRPIRS